MNTHNTCMDMCACEHACMCACELVHTHTHTIKDALWFQKKFLNEFFIYTYGVEFYFFTF